MKHSISKQPQLPIKKALTLILLSVLLISGTAASAIFYFQYIKNLQASDDQFKIVALIQTTSEKEHLKTNYLAELLDLSVDRPTNLYRFNAKEAQRKLLSHPLIASAVVKKIRPGTVYVDYTLRKPVAFLIDYTNTAIDKEGNPFPFKPFFTPKKLPELYLGLSLYSDPEILSGGQWNVPLKGKCAELGLKILSELLQIYSTPATSLLRIDVSRAYASSCGQRQIVITLEDRIERESNGNAVLMIFPRILRLNTENYREGLANYRVLQEYLLDQIGEKDSPHDKNDIKGEEIGQKVIRKPSMVIDLRLSQLAFISN